MFKRNLGKNSLGVDRIFHYDDITDKCHIEYKQDVTPLLERSKKLANDESYSKKGIKDDWWHFANIPAVIQLKWIQEYGEKNDPMKPENEPLLFRLLNSPEYRYLKATNKIHLVKEAHTD